MKNKIMGVSKQVIWIAGGTGLVGHHLVNTLDHNIYDIYLLSRSKGKKNRNGVTYICWDPALSHIDDAPEPDHIINLAGAGIADARWTNARKQELVDSRIDSALTIQKYLQKNQWQPKTYISASAVGYYGDRGAEVLTETSTPGKEFMSDCCVQWESAANQAGVLAERCVILRIGIVLSTLGGALPKMLMTKSVGIFNYFGNGKQYYPWIHIDDLCRMMVFALKNDDMKGVYNAIAPEQITNKNMMLSIKTALDTPGILMPAPAFGLQLLLGEMAHVVLNSNRVSALKIISSGFTFRFEEVGYAVSDVVDKGI